MAYKFPPRDIMEKALQSFSPATTAQLRLNYYLDCYTTDIVRFLSKHGLEDEFYQDKEVRHSKELLSTGINNLDDAILTETQTKISEIEEKVIGIEIMLEKNNKKDIDNNK